MPSIGNFIPSVESSSSLASAERTLYSPSEYKKYSSTSPITQRSPLYDKKPYPSPSTESPSSQKVADFRIGLLSSSLESTGEDKASYGSGRSGRYSDERKVSPYADLLGRSLSDKVIRDKSDVLDRNHDSSESGYIRRSLLSDDQVKLTSSYNRLKSSPQDNNSSLSIQGSLPHKSTHHYRPSATETSFLPDSSQTKTRHSVRDSRTTEEEPKVTVTESSPRQNQSQQLSVFNYGGGERGGSRNHLHMLMNHNLMAAHSITERHEEEASKRKAGLKKSRKKITANLQGTRYEVVREVVENLGYTVTKDEDNLAYLIWNDSFVATERISELKSFQRINHFPGMGEICRKDCLARNMNKMARAHPEEFNFVPKTWILPQEYNTLQNYAKDLKKKKKSKIFIVKPANGAMGNGISLYHNAEKIPPSEHFVVQEYVERPFLIDGYKCDLRIYVLLTSCDPLKLFLFDDGLVRMATEVYKDPSPQNLDVLFMHLTNYSINKHSEGYEKGQGIDSGSKRSLKFLNNYLRHHDIDVSSIWASITDLIVKTLICALPHVFHAYRMCRPGQPANSESVCFEILGFDIMLDRKLKPWLIEVNRSPSFGTNEQIDHDIKSALLMDSLKLVNIRASDKRKNMAAQKAAAQRRLLQPRGGLIDSDERKRTGQGRRKEELKEMLAKIRRENAKLEYEDRNCGRFRRIFPPQDKFLQEKYAKLLYSAFNNLVIGAGKNGTIAKEIEMQYLRKYKEEDILDMLAQYESEEMSNDRVRKSRGPPPLTAMPCSNPVSDTKRQDTNSEDDSDSGDEDFNRPVKAQRPTRSQSFRSTARPVSATRPSSRHGSLARDRRGSPSSRETNRIRASLMEDTEAVNRAIKEKEEELVGVVLSALQEMKIKYPGKSDPEADVILTSVMEDWKTHKPKVASYWLVKLDSVKRRKVIDIVRSNVRAKVQHIYQTHDIESVRIFRIFGRVFNRLLWSHGQGLWNCFAGNSWEMIFSKSTDVISNTEMECCRRITQLCKDCLLIVYQFATEARNKQQSDNDINRSEQNNSQAAALSTKATPTSAGSFTPMQANLRPTQSPNTIYKSSHSRILD